MNELTAFTNEFRRYRGLGEKALARLDGEALNRVLAEETNSAAMLVRHISGNLKSRFTNFLTEDGEKPWRDRDAEFDERHYRRDEIDQLWSEGWTVLEAALSQLGAGDLERTVTIRGEALTVREALARAVAHLAYHVGQIVLLARLLVSPGDWESLSIPKHRSAD